MDERYTPISCAAHDELLALATLRRECELAVANGEGRTTYLRGVIVDVYSRAGAEFLDLSDGTTLRLDRIRAVDGEPVPPP